MLGVLRRGGVLTAIAGAIAMSGVGAGCHREGPYPGVSIDEYTYVSRTWEPKTITVVDTRTNEAIWSVDIPVGQELVVGFSKGTGPNEYTPDEIVWGLMPAGKTFGARHNRMPCPPSYARRLDMKIRPAPESVWSDVPGAPNYRPEPRPIVNTGGRVVAPVERRPTGTPSAPEPAPSPSVQPPNPTSPPPVQNEPAPASQPAADTPEPEQPPIDLPD